MQFEPQEEFIIELQRVPDITSIKIVGVLKDTVLLSMGQGQCYDGATNMKKVAAEIKSFGSHVLYLHCYGHSINVAVPDTKIIRMAPVFYACEKGLLLHPTGSVECTSFGAGGFTQYVKYTRYRDREVHPTQVCLSILV